MNFGTGCLFDDIEIERLMTALYVGVYRRMGPQLTETAAQLMATTALLTDIAARLSAIEARLAEKKAGRKKAAGERGDDQ